MSIVATVLKAGEEIRWTVTVTGRSARNLTRECTCYRPETTREEAEQAAIEEAIRGWPASTKPIAVSSYEPRNTSAGDDWKEVCRYCQRDLTHPCPDHPDYHVDSRGWCWFGGHYPNKGVQMEAVKESPSSEAVETPIVQPYEKLPECYGHFEACPSKFAPSGACIYTEPCQRITNDPEDQPTEADDDFNRDGKPLIPDHAPECYGKPEMADDAQCDACEVLHLCLQYVELSEQLRDPEVAPELPVDNPRPDYRVIDKNTGEMVQLSLLGAQWEAYKVESLRWSLSGGDECIRTIFDELVTGGELSPGAIVEVTARGVVKEHAPIYKKGSHEGKTVISLVVLHRVHVLGHMTGSVEAGQNVDGEAKVLEGTMAEPQTCMNCAHGDEGVDDPGSPCAECASERDRWEPKVEATDGE